MIEGQNGKFKKGTKDGLTFRSNAPFADFISVSVDGTVIDAKNYREKEGSTIVTLNAEYLETLANGGHTIGIKSQAGTAEAEFSVVAADPTKPSPPQTGDNSNMILWIGLLFVSGACIAGTAVFGKKKKYQK